MNKLLPALLATTSLAVAELVPFSLENGLSPVPPPVGGTASTGSGGAIESGLWFDTETLTLSLVLGYGSSVTFTDLTGPATAMHIHGPAGDNPDAVLYDLGPQHFPNSTAAKGGIIRGAVMFDPGQTNDLFQGKDYINIHTEAFPGGEIRGTLLPVLNQAPTLACPENVTAECAGPHGNELTLTARVSDPEGDAFAVVWSIDGDAVQTNDVPAGAAGAVVELSLDARFTLGEHTVTLRAADAEHASECETQVVIQDTTPPDIRRIAASPRFLWPPNHKLVTVRLRPEILDCSATTWSIVSVTSNEPEDGDGDGHTSPDWVITEHHGLQLRAERSGKGRGRTYTVTIEATDAGGLKSQGRVEVKVPHHLGWWW